MDIDRLYEKLAAPAQRALRELKLSKVEDLASHSRAEIAGLHGIGPNALKTIEAEMTALGLTFKPADERSPEVDEYISAFSGPCREKLAEIREIIRSAAPDAAERFAYRMPSYDLDGPLVYFAGYARHVGFYPTASGIASFADELTAYKSSKGAVQFPLDKPLPADLIRRIVEFRVRENRGKGKKKTP